MSEKMLDTASMNLIFDEARTYYGWEDKSVEDELLLKIYNHMKWGATSTNVSPMRIIFVSSLEAKERLKPCLMEANVAKTMEAPVTAIIGYDLDFYKLLPRLSPHNNAYSWFEGNDAYINDTAYQNGTLQGAYFMIAARACGLDCGPMSGFSRDKVDEAFFAGTKIKSNFLCNLGYGRKESLYPRAERLNFDEVCQKI